MRQGIDDVVHAELVGFVGRVEWMEAFARPFPAPPARSHRIFSATSRRSFEVEESDADIISLDGVLD
jgi:hypothetical protein